MKRLLICVALAVASFSLAQANDLRVTFEPIERGVRLDAGNGPHEFVCDQTKVTTVLRPGPKPLLMSGTYLFVTFSPEDAHISFDATDQARPVLANQVRLNCKDGVVIKKLGALIVEDQP